MRPHDTRRARSQAGLTIVELLISVAIITVLITVVFAPMIQAFRAVGSSDRSSGATTNAQQVMETIRGQWQTRSNFDQTCVSGYTLPSGVSLEVRGFDSQTGGSGTGLTLATSCPATAAVYTIKRVTVVSTNGQMQSSLTLDIPRP